MLHDTSNRITDKQPPPTLLNRLLKNELASKRQNRKSISQQLDTTTSEAVRPHNAQTAQNFYINTSRGDDTKEVASIRRDLKALTDQISRQQRVSSSRAPSASVYPLNPPSSPIASTITGDVNDFVDWMIHEYPKEVENFNIARTILLEHQVTLSLIQSTKRPVEWDDYGIARGVGSIFAKNVKRWERSQNHTPSPSRSTRLPVRLSPFKGKGRIIESIEEAIDSQAHIEI